MGRYFGNTPQVGVGNAFLDAFNRSLAQAKQDRLVNRSIRMQDEDRASAKVMQGLQVQEQYPGTTILPTSYTGVGPGTLPNPVDQVQIGKVEPGQPLNVQSGPGLDFSVPGAVTDVGEKQRILTDRLQRSLTSAFAGAQAKAAGEAAGNPLAGDVARSTIAKNLAQAGKDNRIPTPVPTAADKINGRIRELVSQGKPLAQANQQARLEYGEQNAQPGGSNGNAVTPDMKFKSDQRNKIIDDFRADTKKFDDVQSGWEVLSGAVKNPSLATPFALADAYARISNPGAVARPSTIQMIDELGSLDQRVRKYAQKNINGQLPPDVTAALVRTIGGMVREHLKTANTIRSQALTRAQQEGITDLDPILQKFDMVDPVTGESMSSPATPSLEDRIDEMVRQGKTKEQIKAVLGSVQP